MMDGDIARESSGNEDFEIIGGDSPGCSKSDGDGVVVSVEVDVIANGDELSSSKQLDLEEPSRMNGDDADQRGEEEGEISNGRIEREEGEDKPKQSAEDLINEFGMSLDSGVQEEEEDKVSPDVGDVVEEDQLSATTYKTEEASISLDALAKEEEAEPTPEVDDGGQEGGVTIVVDLVGKEDDDTAETQDSTPETPEDSPADTDGVSEPAPEEVAEDTPEPAPEEVAEDTPEDITEDAPEDIPEDTPEDIPEDTPEDIPEDTPEDIPEDTPKDTTEDSANDLIEDTPKDIIEDTPKDIPEMEEDPNQDSAVDVNLDTSQDTSLDISQEISLDVSLDKPQETAENQVDNTPASQDDDQTLTEQSLDESLNSEEDNEGFRPGLTRSKSNRLDSSKFSKFAGSPNSSGSETSSSDSKRHTFAGTGRLNMSRFSQFEQGGSSDSSDGGSRPIKRNAGTRSKSLKFGSATVISELCHVCQKRVYPMEKITADNIIYHNSCFKCSECKKTLRLGTYAACQGTVFCKPHFKQMFKLKGNYDFAQTAQTPASPSQTNGVSDLADNTDSINADRSMEGSTIESPRLVEAPISASHNQSEESAPPSVVRSSDRPEEAMQVKGGTGSVKSRFESGDFQNNSTTTAKSINIYDAPEQKGVSESTPVRKEDIFHSGEAQEEVKAPSAGIGKFKNMFEVGGVTNLEVKSSRDPVSVGSLSEYENTNQGHVAESTPVFRDDVIRSSDTSADPGIKRGLSKSLKNRFETERISNIEEKPREKIDISSSEEKRVYQPPEKPKREDIVNAENNTEDPGIKSGQARSLRSLFEKGNVSNVVEKPRVTLERNPRSLEDYSMQDQVSENTPTRKEDVVSSSTPLDEPVRSAESTRSLKQRWESGQVERVPEKPKPSLERTPQSLDNYSMTMVVSENTPEDRKDIVKSSASSDDYLTSRGGSASSLKAKWESGEVHNADVTSEKTENKPKRFSAYYEGDEQTNGVVEHENGIMEEREEVEEEEEDESSADASWEIKAARAAAMAEIEDE